ncbi:MAG TPA: hypothetical protein VGN44_14835 [Candidatus Angelobacter sp.]
MVDEKGFRERLQNIGQLISGLDEIADKKAQASARELTQLIMALHADGMERMMEIAFAHGIAGAEIIEQLGRDPMVSSLLVLHGLHPDDIQTRVARAVEQVAVKLRKQDVEVQLLSADHQAVQISAHTNAHACASTAATVRAEIEDAIYQAAPEVESLVIEGLESRSANGFVNIDQLMNQATAANLLESKAGD